MTHDLLPMTLLNPAAFAFVMGGTLGVTIMSSSLRHVFSIPGALRRAISGSAPDPASTVPMLVEFALIARREGILALRERVRQVSDGLLKDGIQLAMDGTPPEALRKILEARMISLHERNRLGESVFSTMARFAPGIGVIGTIIGLIQGLPRVDTPAGVGAAFVPALYGVAAAYVFFLPVSARLKARTARETAACDVIIEGILSIQSGDNSYMVEAKLEAMR